MRQGRTPDNARHNLVKSNEMATINTWTDITCPSGCGASLNYGDLPSNPNCTVSPPLSQVSDIVIQPDSASAPFTFSGDDATQVSGEIDNTNTTNTKSKHLVVRGSVGDPEETIYNGPKGARIITKRRYTVEAEIAMTDNKIYDFLRQLQCGEDNFVFWYGTQGGYLFGGSTGISPALINARLPKNGGDEDVEVGTILLEFETTNGDPPRHTNPLA